MPFHAFKRPLAASLVYGRIDFAEPQLSSSAAPRVCSLPVLRRSAHWDVETPAVVAGLYSVTPARLRLPAGACLGQTRRSPSPALLSVTRSRRAKELKAPSRGERGTRTAKQKVKEKPRERSRPQAAPRDKEAWRPRATPSS